MGKSSISKHLGAGPGSGFAIALGAEIRRRRKIGGYTQRQLAHPLTGAYLSAVETGRCLPSLGALLLVASRLGVDPGKLLGAVKGDCPDLYNAGHAASQDRRDCGNVYTRRHARRQDQAAAHRR